MKAVTINISLNPELADFAEADSQAEAFGSVSEYVSDLIRRRRQKRIEEDVKLLEQAIAGAPAGDPSEAEMREIYAIAKRGRRKP
jgi:Arc/MetJ-type ribon-helix-helix transcriptional regulator